MLKHFVILYNLKDTKNKNKLHLKLQIVIV